MDGAMNPYLMEYRWTLQQDDPRLQILTSELGLLEKLLKPIIWE
jgi:hypothetical protein